MLPTMPPAQRRSEFSFTSPPSNPTAASRGGDDDDEEARWLQASRVASPESNSGTPSPRFWAQHQYGHRHRLYPASTGSSPSRAQAIAGYRREMLDLVRGLPESAYELSLRDIVEYSPPPPPPHPLPPPPPTPPPPTAAAAGGGGVEEEERQSKMKKKQGKLGRKRNQRTTRSRSLERSVSMDTGLLIKLFLPLTVGGGGKKKVSPKPPKKTKEKKQGKKEAKEEEWPWNKNEFSEAGSSSRTSSTNSSSSNGGGGGHGSSVSNTKTPTRSRSRKRIGCYGFFKNKSQNGGTED